jgi:hypothetical protein
MRLPVRLRFCACAAFVAVATTLGGCSNDGIRSGPSTDIAALRAIVRIPDDTKSVRWEVFGTPEYHGGVPGPTDYMTLVAELKADDTLWHALPKEGPSDVYIVPDAARAWLSNDFRQLLDKNKNAILTVSQKNDCKPYDTQLSKSGKPVDGFVCKGADRYLLYMMVLSRGPK